MNLEDAIRHRNIADGQVADALNARHRALATLTRAQTTFDTAARHLDATMRRRDELDRLIRELAIANGGGYKPPDEP